LTTAATSQEYSQLIKANTDIPSSTSASVDERNQTTQDLIHDQNNTTQALGASNEVDLQEISSILPVHSPLEKLAKELNKPELQALGEEYRAEYFASRRSFNEEQDKQVKRRLSLARTGTIGSTFSGRSVSVGAQLKYGGHHSPIIEDVERFTLTEDFATDKNMERGFSLLLDQVVAGAWESDYAIQPLKEEDIVEDSTPNPMLESTTGDSTVEIINKSTSPTEQDTSTKVVQQVGTDLSPQTSPRIKESLAQPNKQIKPPPYLNRKPIIRERVRTLEQMEHQVRNSSL
jgi:hypothetical protein